MRFLIVYDTDEMRHLMARMVERAGHVAHEAADGVNATLSLSSQPYDVLLRDLSMPRMSGEDVVRWLTPVPTRPLACAPWSLLRGGGENRGTLQELGITGVLAKPFRLQQLMDLIADVTAEISAEG